MCENVKDPVRITDAELDSLRAELPFILSEKRARHVLGVERMALRLGRLFTPAADDIRLLRGAALLHDITKELTTDRHAAIMRAHGVEPTEYDILSPKTLHARTAAMLIPDRYPQFADERLISAVRWHTTGRAGMSVYDKIIYFADYIDDTRTYDDCVKLRNLFFDAAPDKMDAAALTAHLDGLIVMSFDMTLAELTAKNGLISTDTVDARNYLLCGLIGAQNSADGSAPIQR